MVHITPAQRRRGGLLGLLVGDALGVPYEFTPASAIPRPVEMTPPPGFDRTYPHVPPGTWSDDGAQALVLLESLQRLGRLDVDDVAHGFVRWQREGYYAVGGAGFDIGVQTADALDRIAAGEPAATAGRTDERANGNGSLMRVLPLALWHHARGGSDADVAADACAQSAITHGHPRSLGCCALYVLWARRLLDGTGVATAWDDAAAALRPLVGADVWSEVAAHVLARVDAPARGSGYVVDSLLAARRLLLTAPDYAGVVRAAVELGDDTDTTAAIAGGLAGIVYGEKAIPRPWRDALRGHDLVDPLLAAL